jgi:hypothetical protein
MRSAQPPTKGIVGGFASSALRLIGIRWLLSLEQHFTNRVDVLFNTPASSVDNEMFAVPRMIFPARHFFPSWQR